jgi:hypothetical protein
MRYSLKIGLVFVAVLICLISCGQVKNKKNEAVTQRLKLSEPEINDLLSLLEVSADTIDNFHIQYSEYFNDSTVLVWIKQNQKKPTKDLKVCNIFDFRGSKVFVYDASCNLNVPADLKSTDNQSPLFIPDSPFWQALALRRSGKMNYYSVSFLFKVGEAKDDPFLEYIPDK